MKRTACMVMLGVATAFTAGCPTVFQVLSPQGMQTASMDFECSDGLACQGRAIITVRFTQAVDPDSLIPGTNVILETAVDSPAGITVSLISDFVIEITTVSNLVDLCEFEPDCFFTLRLLGTGADPIVNTEGEALDGDKDGVLGGDFETTFTLLG